MPTARPVIAITPDTHERNEQDRAEGSFRYELSPHYAAAVAAADGTPIILPYEPDAIESYLAMADGFILTGGDDPATEVFGEPTHPAARVMRPERQRFELALLAALDATKHPVLGVCLGMQLMALHHGGRLHQHLADLDSLSKEQVAAHVHRTHGIVRDGTGALPCDGETYSHHHQAVADAGSMRIAARSDAASGSIIEAIERSEDGRFYLGVQWHPERSAGSPLGHGLIVSLVDAARVTRRGPR